jgi:hypothetical protein
VRPEATLQDLILRDRRLSGHQTRSAYEPCQHCGTLISGSHSCPVLDGRGAQDLARVRLFVLAMSLWRTRKAESKPRSKSNIRRFDGLLRKSA